jgi:hypothetical protein
MILPPLLCHAATAPVSAPAKQAFAFMADGVKLGRWALGCLDTKEIEPGLFAGRSQFTGGIGYVRIAADPALLNVDYHVGAARNALSHQNTARIIAGAALGRAADSCMVTLIAWRTAGMSDDDWRLICATHESEIYVVKSMIEREIP